MTIALGRIGRLKKNGVEIGKITTPSLTISSTTIPLSALGDDWDKVAVGMNSYVLAFTMFMVADDSNQNAIYTASVTKVGLTDIELWTDSTTYFECNVIADPEAQMIVESYAITFDNESAVAIAVSLKGSGPITKTTV